jgi:hypothetical protein
VEIRGVDIPVELWILVGWRSLLIVVCREDKIEENYLLSGFMFNTGRNAVLRGEVAIESVSLSIEVGKLGWQGWRT